MSAAILPQGTRLCRPILRVKWKNIRLTGLYEIWSFYVCWVLLGIHDQFEVLVMGAILVRKTALLAKLLNQVPPFVTTVDQTASLLPVALGCWFVVSHAGVQVGPRVLRLGLV